MEQELIPPLKETLFIKGLDLSADYLEIGIDTLLKSEEIKEVPIVGTIIKCAGLAVGIRERHLIKKLLVFVQQLNSGIISEEKLKEYKDTLNNDSRLMERDLGFVLLILDRYIDTIKSKILANLYVAYINKELSWERFIAFANITEQLLIYDLEELKRIYKYYAYGKNEFPDCAQMSRLSALGLVQYFNGVPQVISKNSISGKEKIIRARISSEGKVFCSIMEYGKI